MAALIPQISRGFVLAVSAPSGTGKTSLCDKLRDEMDGIVRSVSVTTRPKRDGEVSGKDYFFVSLDEFKIKEAAGDFLETAEVFGHRYGTPRKPVEEAIVAGRVIVMDIDTVGAFRVRELLKKDAVLLFILPPSLEELEKRLLGRGKNTTEELKTRLAEAKREIGESKDYDYVLSNTDFEEAFQGLMGIVKTERSKPFRLQIKNLQS